MAAWPASEWLTVILTLLAAALGFVAFRRLRRASSSKELPRTVVLQVPVKPRASAPEFPKADNAEEEEVTEFTFTVGGRPMLRMLPGAGHPARDSFLSPIGVTTLGRATDNDVVIPGDAASSHHCRIEKQGAVYVLIDEGSTNRTFVNGSERQRVVLRNGDQIRIGEATLVFALFGDRA